ncbi:MAG: tol-pal system YbgF family protein [Sandaracinaceae bacterium]
MPRALLSLVPLVALLSLVGTALAQEEAPSAAERFRRAVARYESSQYEEALRDFQELYEDTEEPALLYNIARCQEQLGDLDSASTSLRRYLDRVPDADDREAAAQLLEDIDQRRAQTTTTEPDPAPEPQTDPDPDPIAPPDPDPPVVQDEGMSPLALTGISVLAVGAAGVIVGAVLGGLTAGEDSTLREDGRCGATRSCTDDDLSSLHALGIGADIGLFAGGALVVAGVVLLIVGLADGDETQARLTGPVRF